MSLLLFCGFVSFCFSLVSFVCVCVFWLIYKHHFNTPLTQPRRKKHKINFQLHQNTLLHALSKDQHQVSIETKNRWQETAIRENSVWFCILRSLLGIHIGVSYTCVIRVIEKNIDSRGQTQVSVQTLGLQKGTQSEQGLRNCNGGKTPPPGLSKD